MKNSIFLSAGSTKFVEFEVRFEISNFTSLKKKHSPYQSIETKAKKKKEKIKPLPTTILILKKDHGFHLEENKL